MSTDPSGQGRFRILGPLEVWSGEGWTSVGAEKWRSLLACLLLRPGQLVSTDGLISELWDDNPPAKANNLVSIYVHRLRRLIGDTEGRTLVYRAPGYQLRLESGDLDLQQFEALVGDGRRALAADDPQAAAVMLDKALELWRGPALADVTHTALVTTEAARLAELRVTAAELRAVADLACGRTRQVIPELRRLVAENPIREGLWLLLIRALSEAGRHAEALDTYAQARQAISDELGVGPGAELRELYARLLAADTSNAAAHIGAYASSAPKPSVDPAARSHAQTPAGVRGVSAEADLAALSSDDLASREDFGRALDAVRIRAGLTVQEAAWASGISPGEAAGYFTGCDLPALSEAGLKVLHSVLAACGIMDPEQVITWTYVLMKAWSLPGHQPLASAAEHSTETARRADATRALGAVPDVPGFDLCPDPLTARTAADLVTALSRFRVWAGEPSFEEMKRLAEPKASAAAMCTALGNSKLPSLRIVLAIVTGCGGTPQHQQAFTSAWRQIRMKQTLSSQPETPPATRTLYPVRDTDANHSADRDPGKRLA
jgi:DNA-binding SARP family transcriptional activator